MTNIMVIKWMVIVLSSVITDIYGVKMLLVEFEMKPFWGKIPIIYIKKIMYNARKVLLNIEMLTFEQFFVLKMLLITKLFYL